MARTLAAIARDIRKHWTPPNYAAVPYLEAMADLETLDDRYMHDSADGIVLRFLGNASTFRGPEAKRIKAELKLMLQDFKHR